MKFVKLFEGFLNEGSVNAFIDKYKVQLDKSVDLCKKMSDIEAQNESDRYGDAEADYKKLAEDITSMQPEAVITFYGLKGRGDMGIDIKIGNKTWNVKETTGAVGLEDHRTGILTFRGYGDTEASFQPNAYRGRSFGDVGIHAQERIDFFNKILDYFKNLK